MPKPTTKVEIGFDAGWTGTPTWTDVTSYVQHEPGTDLDKWRAEEFSECGPSRCSFTLNNSDGRFTPGNAAGAHYPNVKKGRRIRVVSTLVGNLVPNPSIEVNTTGWAATDGAALARVTTQFDQGIASMSVTAAGALAGAVTSTGTGGFPVTAGLTYTAQARSKAATVARNFSIALAWYNQAGGLIGTTTSALLADSTIAWTLNTITAVAPANAVFGAVWVRWVSAAAEVHWLDSVMAEEAASTETYGDGSQSGWRWSGTAHQSASLREYVRFAGYVNDWSVTWPGVVTTLAKCTVTASSRMARLGSGGDLKSIIEEEILLDGPAAYYTLGEPEGSTQVHDSSGNSAEPLKTVGSGSAVTFGSATGPATDGLTAASFTNAVGPGKYLSGPLSTAGSTSVAIECFSALTEGGGLVELSGADGNRLSLGVLPTGEVYGQILGSGGALLEVTSFATVDDGTVRCFSLRATLAAGTMTLDLFQDGVSLGSDGGAYSAFPAFTTIAVGANPAASIGTLVGSISHVAVFTSTSGDALSSDRLDVHVEAGSTGFADETPADRLTRYAAFAGIPAAETDFETGMVPDLAHIDTTGKTALACMREVETTEAGVLFDAADGTLKFHDRAHRYDATSAFTIAVSDEVVTVPLAPTLDDQQLVNDMSATGATGVTVRVTDVDSLDDHGTYRQSVELATENPDEPLMAAGWRVGRYADPLVRVPEVVVYLNGCTTALTKAVLAAEVGTKLTLTGLPANAPASSMVLFVEGMSERITADQHTVTLRTSDAAVSDVWTVEDPVYGQYDAYPIAY